MIYARPSFFLVTGLVLAFTFGTCVGRTSAAVLSFDLQGRSGPGMLPNNENPSATSNGTGGEVGAGIFYDDVSKQLTINVAWGSANGFSDLTGNVVIAHIHAAADALFTTNGPVTVNLDGVTPGFNSSLSAGGWTNTQVILNGTQEAQLLAGVLYLNAHTNINPAGEIRGNLVQVPEPSTIALAAVGAIGLVGMARRRRSG